MRQIAPSPRVRELIRAGAELILLNQAELLEELNRERWASPGMEVVGSDPVLTAAADRANRATTLQWVAANLRDPGAPVPVHLEPEMLDIARDLVRRGLDESTLAAYRIGHAIAWRLWMRIAFSLTSEPAELQELLDVTSQSISDYVEGASRAIADQMQLERDELIRSNHPERREMIALILDGAPVPTERAEARLGYKLAQPHIAAIVWSREPDIGLGELERGVEVLARLAHTRSQLSIVPGGTTIWVWLPVAAHPDLAQLERELMATPDVRIALGPVGRGVDGFRQSHLGAVTAHRMLANLRSDQRVATFDDIQLASLVTTDSEGARQFVRQTLGDLATADREVRDTVLTFVREQGSIARTAAKTFVHRNTVLRRLERANELLPDGLQRGPLDVAVALEVLRWFGTGALGS